MSDPELLRIHREADKVERRMERAFLKAVERMKADVPVYDLGLAIGAKSLRKAMKLMPASAIEDRLSPLGTITRDAALKGGTIGAEEVNRARRDGD